MKYFFMKNWILTLQLLFLSCWSQAQSTLISDMEKLKWEKVMPGVWKASFGETGLNALDYADPSKTDAIENLGDTPFPFPRIVTVVSRLRSGLRISAPRI